MKEKVQRPDEEWFAKVKEWLVDDEELLMSYTLAGRAGSGGYYLADSIEAIRHFVSTLPKATRIVVYKEKFDCIRGTCDLAFARRASERMPKEGDFLLLSFEKPPYAFGYIGFLGDTDEELYDIVEDSTGEEVAFGASPSLKSQCIVAYVDGVVGKY